MLHDAMRRTALVLMLAMPALAAGPLVPREPFAKAHVSLMARSQSGSAEARLAEIDVWAEGTRLHAKVRDDPKAGEFWVDGLASEALRILDGKVQAPRRRSLEHALQLALAASPSLAGNFRFQDWLIPTGTCPGPCMCAPAHTTGLREAPRSPY